MKNNKTLIKLKEKIKEKLKLFLDINTMQNQLQSNYEIEIMNQIKNRVNDCESKIDALHNTLSNVVSVGTDIDHIPRNNSSWAVVCIEGKNNIVKFYNLDNNDAKRILEFMKQYEAARYVHDTPKAFLPNDFFINW